MNEKIEELLLTLKLTAQAPKDGEDIFTGISQIMPHGRVFGGQVMAQALIAATETVPEGRTVHSLHGYFLRPGDMNQDIEFQVDRLTDGRSFSARRTTAVQNGRAILSMIASFQIEEPGFTHQIDWPADLPMPEDLEPSSDLLAKVDHPVAQFWALERPFDLRYVHDPMIIQTDDGHQVPHAAVWMRALDVLPDDPALHRAAMVYASDYSVLEPIYRQHGISWGTPGISVASLDHAMWFRKDGRMDEWVLYALESPSSAKGRGLSFGRIYNRHGELLATVAQEGLFRFPRTD
jgi:acyl-CoA thioesterase-2